MLLLIHIHVIVRASESEEKQAINISRIDCLFIERRKEPFKVISSLGSNDLLISREKIVVVFDQGARTCAVSTLIANLFAGPLDLCIIH
jgi:hypothetical protein